MALTKLRPAGQGFVNGPRNLIINGAMQVNQRNTSTTGTSAFNTDRFEQEYSGGTCTFSWETLSTGSPYDAGFRKFSRLTNTATASATAEYRQFRYTVEAQDVANSGWVYTDPNSYITISFWVRSSIAGKYTFTVETSDGTGHNYNYSRTLVADTWTKVTETLPGHANLQIDNNNGAGLLVRFRTWLGSDYTSATSEDAWVTYNASTISESGIANWAGTTNATFDITGVQLEVGDVATPFEHRIYADELIRCQRYYQSIDYYYDYGTTTANIFYYTNFSFPVTMRANPAMTASAYGSNTGDAKTRYNAVVVNGWIMQDVKPTGCYMRGNHGNIYNYMVGRGKFDAEL